VTFGSTQDPSPRAREWEKLLGSRLTDMNPDVAHCRGAFATESHEAQRLASLSALKAPPVGDSQGLRGSSAHSAAMFFAVPVPALRLHGYGRKTMVAWEHWASVLYVCRMCARVRVQVYSVRLRYIVVSTASSPVSDAAGPRKNKRRSASAALALRPFRGAFTLSPPSLAFRASALLSVHPFTHSHPLILLHPNSLSLLVLSIHHARLLPGVFSDLHRCSSLPSSFCFASPKPWSNYSLDPSA
jgi:hypothetical protein